MTDRWLCGEVFWFGLFFFLVEVSTNATSSLRRDVLVAF